MGSMKRQLSTLAAARWVATAVTLAGAQPGSGQAGAGQRAASLVAQMTLEEKAGQLQHRAAAIPRASEAMVFPQAIAMAATWDSDLTDMVRKDWAFDGHIGSDCVAVSDIHLPNAHAYAKTPEEAVAAVVKAGTDLMYPFGYGLNYTTFRYERPTVSRRSIGAGGSVDLSVEVRNAGDRDGDEVVQLYVSRREDSAPIRALANFQRIHLKAGECRTVRFTVDARAISVVDGEGRRLVSPGAVALWVGGGQPQRTNPSAGIATTFVVTGRAVLKAF